MSAGRMPGAASTAPNAQKPVGAARPAPGGWAGSTQTSSREALPLPLTQQGPNAERGPESCGFHTGGRAASCRRGFCQGASPMGCVASGVRGSQGPGRGRGGEAGGCRGKRSPPPLGSRGNRDRLGSCQRVGMAKVFLSKGGNNLSASGRLAWGPWSR